MRVIKKTIYPTTEIKIITFEKESSSAPLVLLVLVHPIGTRIVFRTFIVDRRKQ
jgi:hypothetical protein